MNTGRPLRGVRALVTGASGFIGSWVVRALHDAGAHVTCVVRSHDAAARLAASNLGHALVTMDLTDLALVADAIPALRPQVVFNLAAYGVDPRERDDEVADVLNHQLPAALVRALSPVGRDSPGARLVHAGSALEYGTTGGVLSEHSPCRPTTSYGRTKLAGATAALAAGESVGVEVCVARLFTVYGPGEHEGRLLPSIVRSAKSGEALRLSGGTQRRDFAYVEEAAAALLQLAGAPETIAGTVNVATGTMHTVREFASIAAVVAGLPADRLLFGALPTRPEEMEHDGVSVARLIGHLGHALPDDISGGVQRTLDRLAGPDVRAP
jgi:nucleoside-diphosphate-sugar epimerase